MNIISRFSSLHSIFKMSWFYFAVFVFVSVVVGQRTGKIYPQHPKGLELRDLRVKIMGVKAPLSSCTITFDFNDIQVLLDREHPHDVNVTYIDNWEKGGCGVHFSPLTDDRAGTWNFKVINGDGKEESYTTKVEIIRESEPFTLSKRYKKVEIGGDVTLFCVDKSAIYARLYDPTGKLVMEGSEAMFTIYQAKYEHNGTWTCLLLFDSVFEEISHDINLEGWQNSIFINLYCPS